MNRMQRNISSLVALSLLALLWGCADIPTQQFEAYKRAFKDVRASGEEVLLDYGVAKSDSEKRRKALSGGGEVDSGDRFAFDISAITETEKPLDGVGVRMHAWNVLAQYNETLTAVAQGHSPAEISAAFDGLTQALNKFPIGAISEAAKELVPYAGVAKAALEIIEREIAAGRFIESIQAIYPEINKFLDLLESDAQNFYNIRLGLHDLVYEPIIDQIADNEGSFQDLLEGFDIPADTGEEETTHRIYPLIKQVNNTLAGIPDWPSENILVVSQSGDKEYTELAHSQFFDLANQIERLAGEAKAVDDELIAYRNMLIEYVKLIQQTRRALKAVIEAVEENQQPEVVAQNMFDAAVKLRRAIAEYKKAR